MTKPYHFVIRCFVDVTEYNTYFSAWVENDKGTLKGIVLWGPVKYAAIPDKGMADLYITTHYNVRKVRCLYTEQFTINHIKIL